MRNDSYQCETDCVINGFLTADDKNVGGVFGCGFTLKRTRVLRLSILMDVKKERRMEVERERMNLEEKKKMYEIHEVKMVKFFFN